MVVFYDFAVQLCHSAMWGYWPRNNTTSFMRTRSQHFHGHFRGGSFTLWSAKFVLDTIFGPRLCSNVGVVAYASAQITKSHKKWVFSLQIAVHTEIRYISCELLKCLTKVDLCLFLYFVPLQQVTCNFQTCQTIVCRKGILLLLSYEK